MRLERQYIHGGHQQQRGPISELGPAIGKARVHLLGRNTPKKNVKNSSAGKDKFEASAPCLERTYFLGVGFGA